MRYTILILLGCVAVIQLACGSYGDLMPSQTRSAELLAKLNPADLRARGPSSLTTLREAYQEALAEGGVDTAAWDALFDSVAAQRHARHSGMYWYTDLDRAKQAAQTENKPIISLRLWGKLTEEYSCANSRFFRTVLYANPDVSAFMRENFILHWQSLGPLPMISIDMPNGQRISNTLTGNSVHLILDSQAQLCDALPGMYSSMDFISALHETRQHFNQSADSYATDYHQEQVKELTAYWDNFEISQQLRGLTKTDILGLSPGQRIAADAIAADRLAVTKRAGLPARNVLNGQQGHDLVTSIVASCLAQQNRSFLHLPLQAALVHQEFLHTAQTIGIDDPEVHAQRAMAELDDVIQDDSNMNAKYLRYFVHRQLAKGMTKTDDFVAWLYRDCFLMDIHDPWYGLEPAKRYTGLNVGGLRSATTQTDELAAH